MKTASYKMAQFTGLFVGIAVIVRQYVWPDASLFTKLMTAGLAALIGGWIGNRLFPNKR